MKIANVIAWIILIIGGLNWLLVGVFSFDLVAAIFGSLSIVSRIVYSLVGLSAIWLLIVPFLTPGKIRLWNND